MSIRKYNYFEAFFSVGIEIAELLHLKEPDIDKKPFFEAINTLIPFLNNIQERYNCKPLNSLAIDDFRRCILPALKNYLRIVCNCNSTNGIRAGKEYYNVQLLYLVVEILSSTDIREWKKYGFKQIDFNPSLLLRNILRYLYEKKYISKSEVYQYLMRDSKDYNPEHYKWILWLNKDETKC